MPDPEHETDLTCPKCGWHLGDLPGNWSVFQQLTDGPEMRRDGYGVLRCHNRHCHVFWEVGRMDQERAA